MNKIRINELARELEVKAHEILDRLPELGVTEKKTHSSSIDEDVALKLRRLFGHEVPEEYAEPEEPAARPPETPAAAVETSPVTEGAPRGVLVQPPPPAVEEKIPESAAAKVALDRPMGRPAQPIRPPLAGSSPPSAQHTAPVTPRVPSPPPSPAVPPAAVMAPSRPAPPAARPERTYLPFGSHSRQTRRGCARAHRP